MKAVVYAAKSTKDVHLSIPEQLDDCREMCAENDWQIVGEFRDENFTAYTGNRGPGLAQAIGLAKQIAAQDGECLIVAQHTSRFARGDGARPDAPRALVELWHEWARSNVRARLVENDLAMQTSSAAAAQGEADHNESKRKSKSVKKGLRRRVRDRGKSIGGPRPYGYRWFDGSLVVDPIEAAVVARMFEDTINGVSQRQMARQLIAEGVPTSTGKPWGQSSIARLLANPFYKGLIRLGGELYEGEHEPIVSAETWDRANSIRGSATRQKGGRWPKGSHLLTKGLLRCGRCGYAMVPRTDPYRTRKDGRPYQVYECFGRRQRGVEFCSQGSIHRSLIDEALLADLTSHWLDLEETRRRMAARLDADLAIAQEAVTQAEREAQKAADALARIERDYIDGRITADQWSRIERTLVEERDAAASALQRAQDHAVRVQDAGAMADAEQALLEHLAAIREAVAEGVENGPSLNALRQTIAQLFDRVELMPAPLIDSMAREDGIYLLPILSPAFPEVAVLPTTDHITFPR